MAGASRNPREEGTGASVGKIIEDAKAAAAEFAERNGGGPRGYETWSANAAEEVGLFSDELRFVKRVGFVLGGETACIVNGANALFKTDSLKYHAFRWGRAEVEPVDVDDPADLPQGDEWRRFTSWTGMILTPFGIPFYSIGEADTEWGGMLSWIGNAAVERRKAGVTRLDPLVHLDNRITTIIGFHDPSDNGFDMVAEFMVPDSD